MNGLMIPAVLHKPKLSFTRTLPSQQKRSIPKSWVKVAAAQHEALIRTSTERIFADCFLAKQDFFLAWQWTRAIYP
ncbi:hypothetical protein CDAR_440521 [Caerostris darwini]|uniref:Uncharacterized protein n=1 Tax=Caerostris darwini TaxID=1538125 RepID=A0AAV4S622_9ARAC|nr:hypothetical protein CDAR_440521 [Caerostris darwini]